MPLPRLALSIAAACAFAAPAAAQDLLSRSEVEAILREQALCYHPDDRYSCAWAEIYSEFAADHVILHTASAVWDEPMEVQQYRLNWVDDALCIPYENQGLQAVWEAEGYRFPFDLSGLTPVSEDVIPEMVRELRENSPREFCFRYSIDEAGPDALFQHVYRDGVVDESLDPVALIPLFASGVAISPSG